MRVLIDGVPTDPTAATLSVFDLTILRGAGCFEALRVYDGVAFEVERHLERLTHSARSLAIPLPERGALRAWIDDVAAHGKECMVRVLATPGASDPALAGPRVVVFEEALPSVPEALRLLPLQAPWHAAGAAWALEGVKSLSYGPNVSAQRAAQAEGFDDALLLSREGYVLEAPMAAVAWIRRGQLQTPARSLGILRSITLAVLSEEAARLGIETSEVTATLDDVLAAEELMVLSTSRGVRPVIALGEARFSGGEVTAQLAAAYEARARQRTTS